MNRDVKERTILDTFAEDFVKVAGKHARYVIVSGFVAIAHGRSRGTEDVDIIIERIKKDAFVKMHNDLLQAGFECIQSEDPEVIYDDYLKDKTSVRYVRKGHFVPEMDWQRMNWMIIRSGHGKNCLLQGWSYIFQVLK